MSVKSKKKNLSGKIVCKNGISFRSDIAFSTREDTGSGVYPLVQLGLTFAAAISVIFMAQSYLSPDLVSISNFPIVITVLFTALAVLMMNRSHKSVKAVGAAYLIVYTVFVMTKLKDAVSGMIYVVYVYASKARLTIPISADSSSLDADTFFLTLAFLLTLGISLACIYRTNFPILFICTFPIFELGAFWGWEPAAWTAAVMIVCWVIVLALNIINHTTRNRSSRNTFAVYTKKKTFYLTSDKIKQSFFSFATPFVLIITTAVFTLGALTAAMLDGNFRPARFKELRRSISNGFQELTEQISENTDLGSSFPGKGRMVGGTNGGRLGQYDKISFSGMTALYVTSDKFDKAMYLRGYAAENYSNNEWNPVKLDEDAQSEFTSGGYTALDYNYLRLTDKSEQFNVKIKPEKANDDIIYAPYGTLYSDCGSAEEQEYDGMMTSKTGKDEYSLSGRQPDRNSWEETLDYVCSQTNNRNEYTVYDSIVSSREVYRYVPEDIADTIDEFIRSAGVTENQSAADIIEELRREFSEQGFVYTLEPGRTPVSEDFVEYFLTEQKKGYCTYYASAGVMLMRRLGYPARYVEGYIVEPSQQNSNGGKIRVSDRCAHAWCEVYISGTGWYPIEFTPGYDSDNPNLTDAEKNIKPEESSAASSSAAENSAAAVSSKSDTSKNNSSRSPSSSKSSDSKKSVGSSETSTSNGSAAGANGSGGSGGSGTSGGTPSDKTGAVSVGIAALFVIFTIISAIVRRKTKLSDMERRINSADCTEAVISCYSFLLEYLELIGIENRGNVTDVEAAKDIFAKLNVALPSIAKPFARLSDMAITAYMSESHITADDADEARQILANAGELIYGSMNGLRRSAAKWIHCLY